MNVFTTIFHQAWVARLGWTLLHFLWQGALVAALLSVARGLPGHRPGARFQYAAACLALAVMIAAPFATFLILSAPVSATTQINSVPAVGLAPDGAGSTPLPSPTLWEQVSPYLGIAWLIGMALASLRLLGAWTVAARLRTRNAKPASPEWLPKLHALMQRMCVDRPVRLLVSSMVETPAVIGWLRPVILVPVGALAGLPAAHVEALLAHELAHIRRHDYLVNLLQSVAEAVLFYHPAVWWVSSRIRVEREHCCDDLAVQYTGGNVLTYARALAEFESCRPAHAQAMAANTGSLPDRIRRLLNPAPAHTMPARGAAWGLVATMVAGIAIIAGCSAQAPVAHAQEPVVKVSSLWPDTVKQGDVKIQVRGLGTLVSPQAAEVKIAEKQSRQLIAGQTAQIDARVKDHLLPARVRTVHHEVSNGTITVDLDVLAPLPPGINAGVQIDATIEIRTINNVVYVGRPILGETNSEVSIFKIDPDGQHATRVKVQFGQESVNVIEVKSGLQVGDRVILSDMKQYDRFDRITLQ
jgi:beta-lactamase regulating signal transducer with metallopeptidase domain